MSNIFIQLKMTCLGVLNKRRIKRIQWNKFERGRSSKNLFNYKCFSIYAMHALSFRFCISLFDILYIPSQSSLHFHVWCFFVLSIKIFLQVPQKNLAHSRHVLDVPAFAVLLNWCSAFPHPAHVSCCAFPQVTKFCLSCSRSKRELVKV